MATAYIIPTLGDEQRDHDQIEGAVAVLLQINPNLVTTDAEMGEWVVLHDDTDGAQTTITIVENPEA